MKRKHGGRLGKRKKMKRNRRKEMVAQVRRTLYLGNLPATPEGTPEKKWERSKKVCKKLGKDCSLVGVFESLFNRKPTQYELNLVGDLSIVEHPASSTNRQDDHREMLVRAA